MSSKASSNEMFNELQTMKEAELLILAPTSKHWHERYVRLADGALKYFKARKDLASKCTVPLGDCVVEWEEPRIVGNDDRPLHNFAVRSKVTFHVGSYNYSDVNDWYQTLLCAMDVQQYIATCLQYGVEPEEQVTQCLNQAMGKELGLDDTELTFNGLAAITELLPNNESVEELRLTQCGLTDAHCDLLTKAMSESETLQRVTLSNNRISDMGAGILCDALLFNVFLQELDLSHNQVGDVGAAYLAQSLRSNVGLRVLKLRNNRLGKQGALDLAESMVENTTLTELDVSENGVGVEGGTALARAVKKMEQLQSLKMAATEIDSDVCSVLALSLMSHPGMTAVDLSDNDLTGEGLGALASVLRTNPKLTLFEFGSKKALDNSQIADLSGAVMDAGFEMDTLQLTRDTMDRKWVEPESALSSKSARRNTWARV